MIGPHPSSEANGENYRTMPLEPDSDEITRVRIARPEDAPAIARIYNQGISSPRTSPAALSVSALASARLASTTVMANWRASGVTA